MFTLSKRKKAAGFTIVVFLLMALSALLGWFFGKD